MRNEDFKEVMVTTLNRKTNESIGSGYTSKINLEVEMLVFR